MANFPILISSIDITPTSSYVYMHSLSFLDAAGNPRPITNIKNTSSSDFRETTFSMAGYDGHIVQDTDSTSATTGATKNTKNLIGGASACFDNYGCKITFSQPVLLSGISVRSTYQSSYTNTFTISAYIPIISTMKITSAKYTSAKVSSNTYASYATAKWLFPATIPTIKAYKNPDAPEDSLRYFFKLKNPIQ